MSYKKIVIHDFSGHPFQLDLSIELSKTHCEVHHIYFSNEMGPKGNFDNQSIPNNLTIHPIKTFLSYSKGNLLLRFISEFLYGFYILQKLISIKPDLLISGNCPIDSYWGVIIAKKILGFKLIFWVQDLYGIAISSILENKIKFIGSYIGKLYQYREKRFISISDQIVVISDQFKDVLNNKYKVKNKVTIIPNWGNLKDINYSKLKPLDESRRVKMIYTGTMGWKHRPDIIYALAHNLKHIDFEVYSHGVGFEQLKHLYKSKPLQNLKLQGLVPFDRLSSILSNSTICLCVLESDAGAYSVPSKILNYMCSGRGTVLIGPSNNQAFINIKKYKLGIAIEFNQTSYIIRELEERLNNFDIEKYSLNSRKYALKHFNISRIADKFIELF